MSLCLPPPLHQRAEISHSLGGLWGLAGSVHGSYLCCCFVTLGTLPSSLGTPSPTPLLYGAHRQEPPAQKYLYLQAELSHISDYVCTEK